MVEKDKDLIEITLDDLYSVKSIEEDSFEVSSMRGKSVIILFDGGKIKQLKESKSDFNKICIDKKNKKSVDISLIKDGSVKESFTTLLSDNMFMQVCDKVSNYKTLL